MRGTSHAVMFAVSVIIAILTLILVYVVFPRSNCDELARLSIEEMKRAIECAGNYENYKDPVTGKPCNVASVRFCQEDTFSLYGVGYVQAYMGMMVPEYMAYYKEFPKKPVESVFTPGEKPATGVAAVDAYEKLKSLFHFSESYPFERSFAGQRPWDVRPTTTQFKEFFKTKYLEEPCTSGNALCFNIRGREEVVKISSPNVTNVRIVRDGMLIADNDPTFYLIAPCYGKVTFRRGDDVGKEGGRSTIYGYVDKCSAGDASNYCYSDEGTLASLLTAYSAETGCYVVDLITDVLSLGSKPSAKAVAKLAAKTAGKKLAIPASGTQFIAMVAPIPCLDVDYCRGAGACAETAALWPGWPFSELTEANMQSGCKSFDSASSVLMSCCLKYEYGAEKNATKITCDDPADLVKVIKPDIYADVPESELKRVPLDFRNITLKQLTSYMGISESRIGVMCSLIKGNSTKECLETAESRADHNYENCGAYATHTYDFGTVRNERTVFISLKPAAKGCNTTVTVQASNDTKSWAKIAETSMEGNTTRMLLKDGYAFRYLRLADASGSCKFNWSMVALGSAREGAVEAVKGAEYGIEPFRYVYFIVPEGYSATASDLCNQVRTCDSVAKWSESEQGWHKYFKEAGKENFIITGGDEIGLYTLDYSKVAFGNATEAAK
ncbi:MAG: hypothetical protein QXU82_01435 [Candidatus Aenigmatarchaeota archaeon]